MRLTEVRSGIVPDSDGALTMTLIYLIGSGSSVIRIEIANDLETLTRRFSEQVSA